MSNRTAEADLRLRALRAVQTNCDRPQNAMASLLGVTEAAFSKVLAPLKRDGTIKGIFAILDRTKVGYLSLGFFKVNCTDLRASQAVAERLKDDPKVMEVHILDGPHSIMVKVCTPQNEGLSDWQTRTAGLDGVISVRGNVAMRSVKESHELELKL